MSSPRFINDITTFLNVNYSPEEKVSISKDGTKTTFFRKSGKSLCYITNINSIYKVTIVIGASLNDKVQSSNISEKAKMMFVNAKQFHDGKWLHFECSQEQDLKDIKELLNIKRPYKK